MYKTLSITIIALASLSGPSLAYSFHMQPLFRKTPDVMLDARHENGMVPNITPEYVHFVGAFTDSQEWGSVMVRIPLSMGIVEDRIRSLDGFYLMSYFGGNTRGYERGLPSIGMARTKWDPAVSDDLMHWTRYGEAPLVNHHKGISGDAVIQKIGDVYVMFYFGAFWPDVEENAFNRFACSCDLVNWTDCEGEHLIEPSEDYDKLFAHKSCVLKHDGKVYHFYCAVDSAGNRGLALACSANLGKSPLTFPSPAMQID